MSFERKWKRIIISGIETWNSWGNVFLSGLCVALAGAQTLLLVRSRRTKRRDLQYILIQYKHSDLSFSFLWIFLFYFFNCGTVLFLMTYWSLWFLFDDQILHNFYFVMDVNSWPCFRFWWRRSYPTAFILHPVGIAGSSQRASWIVKLWVGTSQMLSFSFSHWFQTGKPET